MIGLIDIGTGNINSVAKALKFLNLNYSVVGDPDAVLKCERYIFPGVGSFSIASRRLEESGLRSCLKNAVEREKKPFLGICLGMQLIAKSGDEGGFAEGLGFIEAEIRKIPNNPNFKIPHVGWNSVKHDSTGLFRGVPEDSDFYFVHSYSMSISDDSVKRFYTNHGEDIVAYIESDNVYGTQFHPEKSQALGLQLLENFVKKC